MIFGSVHHLDGTYAGLNLSGTYAGLNLNMPAEITMHSTIVLHICRMEV